MRLVLFGLFLSFGRFGGAQTLCDSTTWAQPGTYDIIIDTNTYEADITPVIFLSGDDLCLIETSRKPMVTTQIYIGIYLVTIYPKKKIAGNTIEE